MLTFAAEASSKQTNTLTLYVSAHVFLVFLEEAGEALSFWTRCSAVFGQSLAGQQNQHKGRTSPQLADVHVFHM